MPKKENPSTNKYTLPSYIGRNFDQERDILTRKPDIHWEEPPTEVNEENFEDPYTDIEDARQTIKDLISAYKAVEELAAVAQDRIDQRVGDYSIQLDPVADAPVIDAIKRSFPEARDPTKISYEMYKNCLARADNSQLPSLTQDDVLNAMNDPFKTDFGGYGGIPGLNRPEITNGIVQPIDTSSFQESAVQKLFSIMTPLIAGLILTVGATAFKSKAGI